MIGDTIHAVASPPGAGERAVLRLSGPLAFEALRAVFAAQQPSALPGQRAQVEGHVLLRGRRTAALLLTMPAPRSYTGEDVVELHLPGSPMLVAELQATLQAQFGASGLRPALPGEFTRRAFLNGRLDLLQAEGVLLLIHGRSEHELRQGQQWLAGGLSAAVDAVRRELLDALASVEAGLDFTADETGAVAAATWRAPLQRAGAALRALAGTLPAVAPGGELLLLGAANAGKSSLCNALTGRDELLVSARAGTTRDLLRVELGPGVALWDAPGDQERPGHWDRAALALRDRLGARAAAALLVVDPSAPAATPANSPLPIAAVIVTKQDLGLPLPVVAVDAPCLRVSAHTGQGLDALRAFLQRHGAAGARDLGAPLRAAVAEADAAVAAAQAMGSDAAAELLAAEVRLALDALARIDGTHSPEDLLDRIFGRFCLGK